MSLISRNVRCKTFLRAAPQAPWTYAQASKVRSSSKASSTVVHTASGAPDKRADGKKRKIRCFRYISTLDKTKLSSLDFIDISDFTVALIRIRPSEKLKETPFIRLRKYLFSNDPHGMRFPPGSHGFLYYHPPSSEFYCPRLDILDHGHLRFRITDGPNPALFDKGTDMLTPDGRPWIGRRGLTWRWKALPIKKYDITTALIAEGLASEADIKQWMAGPHCPGTVSCILRNTREPFLLDFALRSRFDVHGVEWDPTFHLNLPLNHARTYYQGAALCQFEPYRRDEMGKVTALGLRILKIVEPFVITPGLVSLHPPMVPKEGELFRRWRGDAVVEDIVTFSTKRKAAAAILKAFNEERP